MNRSESERITVTLLRAFPRDTLSNEQVQTFAGEVSLLTDPSVAQDAAVEILRNADRFPTIKEFRETYKAVNERRLAAIPRLEAARHPIPQWVHVWKWARDQGDRRYLPQQAPALSRSERTMSPDEYQMLEAEWAAAGSPATFDVKGILDV